MSAFNSRKCHLVIALLLCAFGVTLAQRRFGGGYRWGRYDYESARNARDIPQDHDPTPYWTNALGFAHDLFTFVRIKRGRSEHGGWDAGGPWHTDTPDSDLNLSWRLQQMTSMRVDDGLFLHLTDKELTDYPFIYMVEPGSLYLTDEEAQTLGKYLLNGGFLMLDDFWGEVQWDNMAEEMKKVFPDRSFVELPLSNQLYHCVFDIKAKDQIPNVRTGMQSEYTHVTWEDHNGEECKEVHHRVIYDDKGRIMVFAAHNTDNGDGWEWEGDNHYYFEHFSEKIAYPLAVNVIFYAMTH